MDGMFFWTTWPDFRLFSVRLCLKHPVNSRFSAEKCGQLAQRLLETEKKLTDTSKLADGYEKDLSQERVDRIRLEDKLSVLNLESTKRIEAATNMNKLLADQLAELEKSTGATLEQLNYELRKAIDKYAKLEMKYIDLNRKYALIM